MSKIDFQKPTTITLSVLRTAVASGVSIKRFIDDAQRKTVQVNFDLLNDKGAPIENKWATLWTGADYNKAGQYTDADIQARVQELAVAGTL